MPLRFGLAQATSVQKKIRAAHAKEKQQIQETCNRPNRLNLLIWTAAGDWRSNYLRFFRTGGSRSRPDCCSCRRLWRQSADEDSGSYNAISPWVALFA